MVDISIKYTVYNTWYIYNKRYMVENIEIFIHAIRAQGRGAKATQSRLRRRIEKDTDTHACCSGAEHAIVL